MDENRFFIPPCCVDKKLPTAILQAPHRALSFYTMGDVTMEKFYRAISYLVEDPHVMVLTMPIAGFTTAAFLCQCFERGWITDLVLSTSNNFSSCMEKYLKDYSSHILYIQHNNVTDYASHLVIYSSRQHLSIQGPMVESRVCSTTLVSYTMHYSPRPECPTRLPYANPLLNVLYPDIERHHKAQQAAIVGKYSEPLRRFLFSELPPYEK